MIWTLQRWARGALSSGSYLLISLLRNGQSVTLSKRKGANQPRPGRYARRLRRANRLLWSCICASDLTWTR
jgi:hypothetical protein